MVNGQPTAPEIKQRLAEVAEYVLNDNVPEKVRIHFETAKNLYLYAWFVYRFHMVAEHYVYATLELALRVRFYPPEGEAGARKTPPTLEPLLRRARKEGLLANKSLSVSQRRALVNARQRHTMQIIERMRAEGLDEIAYDESDIVPGDEDYSFDCLAVWTKTIPQVRNTHAHGTTSLWPTVLGSFELVSEMINQLFVESTNAS